MCHTKRKVIVFDSALRVGGAASASNPARCILSEALYAYQIGILHARIPRVFYNVTSSNNVIRFDEGTGPISATIPPGSYGPAALKSAVESSMTTASGAGIVYTYTYSSTTFLSTISGTAAFSLLFSNTAQSAGTLLGFASVDTASLLTHTSTYALELHTIRNLYVDLYEAGQRVVTSRSPSGAQVPATFVIPVDAAPSEIIAYDGYHQGTQVVEFGDKRPLTEFTVCLRDSDGTIIDMLGADLSISFEVVFEESQ